MEKEVIGNPPSVQNIENVLKVQIQQDKQEEMNKDKRKLNLVMHGVVESTAAESEQRVVDDCDRVQKLLHITKCDSVNVKQIRGLGKRPPGSDDKPRPILLHLDTKESKIKVLRGAKNSRTTKEGERGFIHPDLTTNERESSSVFAVMICIVVIGLQVIEDEFFCTLRAPYHLFS